MWNLKTSPTISALLSFFVLATFSLTESLYAQQSTPEARNMGASKDTTAVPMIKLRKKFFKPLKFTYGDSKPKDVLGLFSFDSSFKNVMAIHPPALREAKRCYPYFMVNSAAWTAFLVLSIKNLIDTIKDARTLSRGELAMSGGINDLVLPIVAGSAGIISANLGYVHIKKGVKIFNERQVKAAGILSSAKNSGNFRNDNNRASSNIGIKLGINSANINQDTKSNGGLILGGFFLHKFNNFFSIQPEVLFSMKGYQSRENDFAVDLNYLEIPLLAKISIPTHSNFQPSFWIGPAYGIKLGGHAEFDGGEYPIEYLSFKSTEWGLALGFGGNIGNSPFTFSIMSTSGLTSIRENSDTKNRVFSLMFGVTF